MDDLKNGRGVGEYNIGVQFGDYKIVTFDDKIDTVTKAVQGNVMDIRTAVERLYPEKSDDELDIMVRNIKLETGVPLLEGDIEVDTDEVA
jgi:hypothetical protein